MRRSRASLLLMLLALVVPLRDEDLAAAGPDENPATEDVQLGEELFHLWPLEKPIYINRQGKVVLQVEGDRADDFSEGLAAVSVNNKWGFIDPRGQWVIPPQFGRVGRFSDGMATVEIGDRWGYIDRSGKVVIELQFTEAWAFHDGRAAVNVGKPFIPFHQVQEREMGFIDKQGKWVVKPTYSSAGGFSEGVARVSRGLIDRSGNQVLDLGGYLNAGSFREGLIAVEKNGLYGYVDRYGKWVSEPQFAWAEAFSEGLASVTFPVATNPLSTDRRRGYIDRSGKLVIRPQFAEGGDFHEGLARVRPVKTGPVYGKGDRWGYIDKQGKFVIPLIYNEAWNFSRGVAWVHRGGKLVDISTHQPMQWEGGQWMLIDTRDNVIWREPTEDSDAAKGATSPQQGASRPWNSRRFRLRWRCR